MKLRYLTAPFELKALDDETGVIEGHASVFGNVDLGGDRVRRGAFRKSLKALKDSGRVLPLFWRHTEPIGVVEEAKEDSRGLLVSVRPLAEVARGREALELVKAGAVREFSIGFDGLTSESTIDKAGVRELKTIDLKEVSLVPFAMNPEALVTAVKALDQFASEAELRAALVEGRDFDPELAERVASAAWREMESDEDFSGVLDELTRQLEVNRT